MVKRMFLILLLTLLCVGCFSLVMAEEEALSVSITFDKYRLNPGETITATVHIKGDAEYYSADFTWQIGDNRLGKLT